MGTNRVMDHGHQSHLYNTRVKTFNTRMLHYERNKNDSLYEEDYRFYVPDKRQMYKWGPDKSDVSKKISSKPLAKYDQESYCPMKEGAHVPFNLLWDANPITGTYPKMNLIQNKDEIQEKHARMTEEERLEAIRTRPRVVISPAVHLDDIDDNEVRNLITANTYESHWTRAARETANAHFKFKNTYPICTELGRNTLHFTPNLQPVIHYNFRRKARSWDKAQAKEVVDPTAKFWLNNELKENDIFATEKLVTQETKHEIKRLILEDKLRTAHDLTIPRYGGFYPRVSYGVDLKKSDLPVTHPNISVSQAITVRYGEDLLAGRRAQWKRWDLQ